MLLSGRSTSNWTDSSRRRIGHRLTAGKHDRRVRGTRGNIDHIVIAPAGIFIVDAKSYKGIIRIRDRGGFLRLDYRLYVGRRYCSKLADAMWWQVDAVMRALVDADEDPIPPITPVLCFVNGDWPIFRAPDEFEGVCLENERSIKNLVTRSVELDSAEIDRLTAILASALPAEVVEMLGAEGNLCAVAAPPIVAGVVGSLLESREIGVEKRMASLGREFPGRHGEVTTHDGVEAERRIVPALLMRWTGRRRLFDAATRRVTLRHACCAPFAAHGRADLVPPRGFEPLTAGFRVRRSATETYGGGVSAGYRVRITGESLVPGKSLSRIPRH
jgi:hypothetical protein